MRSTTVLWCAPYVILLAALTITSRVQACTVPFSRQFLSQPIVVTKTQDFVVLGHVAADRTSVDVVTSFQGDLAGRTELTRPSPPAPCRYLFDTGSDVLVFGRFGENTYVVEELMRVDSGEERRALAELIREKTHPSPTLLGEVERAACRSGKEFALAVVDYELDTTGNLLSATVRETSVHAAHAIESVSEAALALVSSFTPDPLAGSNGGRAIAELACR